jgi:hypothetical protein
MSFWQSAGGPPELELDPDDVLLDVLLDVLWLDAAPSSPQPARGAATSEAIAANETNDRGVKRRISVFIPPRLKDPGRERDRFAPRSRRGR